MFAHTFGYTAVIIAQQVFILVLVWYVMHLLDNARRERRRYNSTMLYTNVAASCDLAALAARLSKFDGPQLDPVIKTAKVRIRHEERR
jgi:uncharacterized membrane protein